MEAAEGSRVSKQEGRWRSQGTSQGESVNSIKVKHRRWQSEGCKENQGQLVELKETSCRAPWEVSRVKRDPTVEFSLQNSRRTVRAEGQGGWRLVDQAVCCCDGTWEEVSQSSSVFQGCCRSTRGAWEEVRFSQKLAVRILEFLQLSACRPSLAW